MLMPSITENWPWAFCHTGSLKDSIPGVPHWYLGRVLIISVVVHTVILQHRVCDGNIDSHMSGGQPLGKMSYIFVLLLVKEIDFSMSSDVGHWVADLHQPIELLVGKLTSGCLIADGGTEH